MQLSTLHTASRRLAALSYARVLSAIFMANWRSLATSVMARCALARHAHAVQIWKRLFPLWLVSLWTARQWKLPIHLLVVHRPAASALLARGPARAAARKALHSPLVESLLWPRVVPFTAGILSSRRWVALALSTLSLEHEVPLAAALASPLVVTFRAVGPRASVGDPKLVGLATPTAV